MKVSLCILIIAGSDLMIQLREKEGLILKATYNNTRGFFIQITGSTKLSL